MNKTCLMPYANDKDADQPVHPHSLISVFVIRCLDSLMSLVSVSKISSLYIARWLSGRVSDSRARGPGFETYLRRVVSLSKTLYSPKVLVNYPGSDGSVPT